MRVRVNKEKLDEVKEKLKPKATILALIGIIFFFFVPEGIAFFIGDEVKEYFYHLAKMYDDQFLQKVYKEVGDMLSENSIINILIGLGFVWWWWHERKDQNSSVS